MAALAGSLLLSAVLAGAGPLPPAPKSYFNDDAGLLPPSVAKRLDDKLRRFDADSANQVIVAIFPELPSPSLEDFTVRTARAWRVGRKKLDNGVVLFVFVKNRKVRLEVGYGLEGALPDALAKRIIDQTIVPAFKAGHQAQGLEAGIDAIIAATRGEYRATPIPLAAPRYPPATTPPGGFDLALFMSIYGAWFFIPFVVPIPILLLRMYRSGQLTVGGGDQGLDSGHTWSSSDSSWSSSSSDSGGSSDFSGGGGDFGGGGASGDW